VVKEEITPYIGKTDFESHINYIMSLEDEFVQSNWRKLIHN
jgi:hypothetical protein